MSEAMLDLLRHNAWANRRLLEVCRGLPGEQLSATTVGAYGSILETLGHLLFAESRYLESLGGKTLGWDEEEATSMAELERWAAEVAEAWERFAAEPFDADRVIFRHLRVGGTWEGRAGIILAQVFHHGSVHRDQVCAILTAQGAEPPDLQAWAYGEDIGGAVFTPPEQ